VQPKPRESQQPLFLLAQLAIPACIPVERTR
jgi:hypothetical protein